MSITQENRRHILDQDLQATNKATFNHILNQIQTSKQKAYAQVNATLVYQGFKI